MIEHEEAGRMIRRHLDGWADTAGLGLAPWQVDVSEQLIGSHGDGPLGIGALLEDAPTTEAPEPVTLDQVLEALRVLRAEEDRELELVRRAADEARARDVGIVVARHPDGELTVSVDPVVAPGEALVVNGQDLPTWSTIEAPLAIEEDRRG